MAGLTVAEMIDSLPENYLLDNVLARGGFGEVVKCLLKDTNQALAVKLPLHKQDTDEEIALLQELMEERMDQRNIVRFIDSFDTRLGRAMVFELLDMSLWGLLEKYDPLPLADIVSIVGQVATALDVLKERSLVHSDLKMDNVMVVDHSQRPLHVKLIDFGLTMPISETESWSTIHHVTHRPPEVILGSGFDEGLDVWCLGVIMSNLWIRFNLFPNVEYEALRVMHKLLGPTPEHILDKGCNTIKFYRRSRSGWKLRTRKDMKASLRYDLKEDGFSEYFGSLKAMIMESVEEEEENTDPALDLLTKMFDMDMNNRITPKQILQHPAICYLQKEASDETANSSHSEEEEEHTPLSCLKIKDILPEEYKFIKTLAVGKFGQFVQCKNTSINQFVTIKVSLSNKRAQREVRLLQEISLAGMDRNNIVTFLDSFQTSHGTVVVLEYLEMSLSAYIDKRYPLPLADIRDIVIQTANALQVLQCKKLIHTGVTAENIFVCSLIEKSPRIKLADFGSVIQTNKAKAGMRVQPLAFRAPEVILGLPFNGSIDIWSLGCTLVQMVTRIQLFSNDSEFKNMETMVRLLGGPDSLDLNKGLKTREFFKRVGGAWALKTLEEFEDFPNFRSALAHLYFERCPSETELLPHYMKYPKELTKCLDLAENMLYLEETDRIAAFEIMEHPFILWRTENDKLESESESDSDSEPVEPENTGDSKEVIDSARKTFDVIQPKDRRSGSDKAEVQEAPVTSPRVIMVKPAAPEDIIELQEVDDVQKESHKVLRSREVYRTFNVSDKAVVQEAPVTSPRVIMVKPAAPENSLRLKEEDHVRSWDSDNDNAELVPVKKDPVISPKVMLEPVQPENTGALKEVVNSPSILMSRKKARKIFDVIQQKDRRSGSDKAEVQEAPVTSPRVIMVKPAAPENSLRLQEEDHVRSVSAEKSAQRDPVQEQQQSGSPLNMETKAEDREPALIQPPTSTSCDKADQQLKDRPKRKLWRVRTAKVQPMSDSTLPPTEDDFVPKKKTKNIFRKAFSWLKRCSCF